MYIYFYDCNVQFLVFKCVVHFSSNFAIKVIKMNLMEGGALRLLRVN